MNHLTTTTIYRENNASLPNISALSDTVGHHFVAVVDPNWKDNNITVINLFVQPLGQPFPAQPTYRITPILKIDSVALDHEGHDLLVYLTVHDAVAAHRLPDGSRPTGIEVCRIPGIYH